MQLPKYSARDTLIYTPERAKHAMFTFEDKVWCLLGLYINDDCYTFEDIDSVPRTADIGLYAAPYDVYIGVHGEAQHLTSESGAVEALCDFVPPTSLFSEPYLPSGRLHVIRRRRSYSPFISPYSVCCYYPHLRSDRTIRWSETSITTTALAARIAGVVRPYSWDYACNELALRGSSTVHPETGTVFIGSLDYQHITAYDGPSCRVELGRLSRRSGKISSTQESLLRLLPETFRANPEE